MSHVNFLTALNVWVFMYVYVCVFLIFLLLCVATGSHWSVSADVDGLQLLLGSDRQSEGVQVHRGMSVRPPPLYLYLPRM